MKKPEGKGYQLQKVTLEQLFRSGRIREPSLSVLRARVRGGIVVFVESSGRSFLYDQQLSIIRVNAARAAKKPGVFWREIERVIQILDSHHHLNEQIKKQLDAGRTEQEVTEAVQEIIEKQLQK
jgi:hypothetical protein